MKTKETKVMKKWNAAGIFFACLLLLLSFPASPAHAGIIHHKVKITNTTDRYCEVTAFYVLTQVKRYDFEANSPNAVHIFESGASCPTALGIYCTDHRQRFESEQFRCISGRKVYQPSGCSPMCFSTDWFIRLGSDGHPKLTKE